MSTPVISDLVYWDQFLALESPDNGQHYELHDGEVVLMPPPKPRHKRAQREIRRGLVLTLNYIVDTECPYRPAEDLQFWIADVACFPAEVEAKLADEDNWTPYTPILIVEILSPSNRLHEVERQRVLAMGSGCAQFWIVDLAKQTIFVTTREGTQAYGKDDKIPLDPLGPDLVFSVGAVFP